MSRRSRLSLDLTAGALGAVAVAFVAGSVARVTGSRASTVIETGVLVLVGLNLLWSLLVVARARVRIVANAADAIVGDHPSVTVAVTGPRRPLWLRMSSSPGAKWLVVTPPDEGRLRAVAPFRGVAESAEFQIVWRGPLGLCGFTRTISVPLARPLVIGPRPVRTNEVALPDAERVARDQAATAPGDGDAVRGVRDYVPGDALRLVHWAATARTGNVVVKELEHASRPRLLIAVDLGRGGPAAEDAAGRAAWLAQDAIGRGFAVTLATCEADGPVTAAVALPIDASRRLARAQPGAPQVPEGATPVLVVSADGDAWR
jgi:uncharacterized protein (DUF58 family)